MLNTIQPTLKSISSFAVGGFQVRTLNSYEFNLDTAKLPALWGKFSNSHLARKSPCFGVYSDYESDANGQYNVTVGVLDESSNPDLDIIAIQAGKYLVFTHQGPMPTAVIETWKQIWHYFAAEPAYQRNFITDFEAYTGPDEVAIHIGVY